MLRGAAGPRAWVWRRTLDGVSDVEVLEIGDRRAGLPRRRLALLAVVIAVLGLTAFAVDRTALQREERAVGRCAQGVEPAVRLAGAPVRGAYEYVRHSLPAAGPDQDLERGIHRLLAEAAAGAEDGLTSPLTECLGVSVWPWHGELRERRDRCIAVLEAHRRGLQELAADGRAVGRWLGVPRAC